MVWRTTTACRQGAVGGEVLAQDPTAESHRPQTYPSLHCNSCWGPPYRILSTKMVKTKQGTAMETRPQSPHFQTRYNVTGFRYHNKSFAHSQPWVLLSRDPNGSPQFIALEP